MSKERITYYYDALCGWCYGFTEDLEKLYKAYGDEFDFEVVSGGLFLGNRVGPINEIAPYIKDGAYLNVEQTTGVKFGTAFLNGPLADGSLVLNSLPPAMAMCIVRELAPNKTFDFASLLLKAVYRDGKDLNQITAYKAAILEIEVDMEVFSFKMKDPHYEKEALSEFESQKNNQISGFPALVIETGGEKALLSRGYANFEALKNRIDQYLKMLANAKENN